MADSFLAPALAIAGADSFCLICLGSSPNSSNNPALAMDGANATVALAALLSQARLLCDCCNASHEDARASNTILDESFIVLLVMNEY
mmetsp:Transcript_854/g.1032  ORF Transcript_854/g.1032 Transcript_854/m.1032 type:complete len:88 (+) Transcript_854:580-843(+)